MDSGSIWTRGPFDPSLIATSKKYASLASSPTFWLVGVGMRPAAGVFPPAAPLPPEPRGRARSSVCTKNFRFSSTFASENAASAIVALSSPSPSARNSSNVPPFASLMACLRFCTTVPLFGFGIIFRGPNIFATFMTCGMIMGVATQRSKPSQPWLMRRTGSVMPATSAPAFNISSTSSSGQNASTLTDVCRPLGKWHVPRTLSRERSTFKRVQNSTLAPASGKMSKARMSLVAWKGVVATRGSSAATAAAAIGEIPSSLARSAANLASSAWVSRSFRM
mmetsp:Transcript_107521/g.302642  ORF Transcript_107521/g.302642 Transcript_107521/m.302642 type:complete len:279 (+) Transcript_107521:128-964(+)